MHTTCDGAESRAEVRDLAQTRGEAPTASYRGGLAARRCAAAVATRRGARALSGRIDAALATTGRFDLPVGRRALLVRRDRVITACSRSAPVSRSPCRRPLRCRPLAVVR